MCVFVVIAGGDLYERQTELSMLATSAGYSVWMPSSSAKGEFIILRRDHRQDARHYLSKGKLEQLADLCRANQAHVVICGFPLSPIQQKNLENTLMLKVLDRSALILETFAIRAQSHEGRLQVELARLTHLSTRLVRGWTHLERQKGGIGMRGGPGETQLEIDRRLITQKIKQLKARIATLIKQRQTQHRQRKRKGLFSIAIVGYTNAGKSTLFNALTGAQAYTADQLFATLDTTTRKLYLGKDCPVVISDTVGFIRDLPHTLIKSFHATLDQACEADLLLHIVDASSPIRRQQINDVNLTLREIGASDIPSILVYNKCDLLKPEPSPILDTAIHDFAPSQESSYQAPFWVSATQKIGLDQLSREIYTRLKQIDVAKLEEVVET